MRTSHILSATLLLVGVARCWAQQPAEELARVLRDKQIITPSEFDRIVTAGPSGGVEQLASILRDKGLITAAEAANLTVTASPAKAADRPAEAANLSASPRPAMAANRPKNSEDPGSDPTRKLKFSGTILFNAFFNDDASNNADFPAFALPRAPGPHNNYGATVRQTRLGLSYSGLRAADADVSGTVEADFFGGEPALANGINMDIVRLRLAYGRLDWKRFAIQAGQDWNIFAPLNPTSFAAFAVPEFSASGNLWIRTPQFRTEWKHDMGSGRTFLWQMAGLDPDIGDNAAAFTTARQPTAGELGRLPAVETRLAFSTPIGDRTATVGASGHWGTAKNTNTINGISTTRSFESWGSAVDFNLPVSRLVNITGEAFAGRALGILSGGIAQTVEPIGQPGDSGVGSRGGWLQVQLNLTKELQSNTAYGIDLPVLSNVPTGSRSKNQTYMSNVIYHLSPNLAFALEWRRFLTNYRNQPAANNIGDHFNLAAAYTF